VAYFCAPITPSGGRLLHAAAHNSPTFPPVSQNPSFFTLKIGERNLLIFAPLEASRSATFERRMLLASIGLRSSDCSSFWKYDRIAATCSPWRWRV